MDHQHLVIPLNIVIIVFLLLVVPCFSMEQSHVITTLKQYYEEDQSIRKEALALARQQQKSIAGCLPKVLLQ